MHKELSGGLQSVEQMNAVTSPVYGKSEILGNELEDFFLSLAFLLPKMYIDCNWKEIILRGEKIMLNRSQSLLNISLNVSLCLMIMIIWPLCGSYGRRAH